MGKWALVTGASSGIGEEFCFRMAKRKINIYAVARNSEKLKQLKKQMESLGVKCVIFQQDLSLKDSAKTIFEDLQKQGITITCLMNNAGYGDYGKYVESDWSRQEKMVQLNVVTLMQLAHLIIPTMITNGGGTVINVSSMVAFQAGPYWAAYSASKAFVLSFSESLSQEHKKDHIKVYALCPGPSKTNFESNAHMSHSFLFKTLKNTTASQVVNYTMNKLGSGKVILIPGFSNKILMGLTKFAPRILTRKIMAKLMQDGKLNKR